jgi:hypothetical protein
MKKQICMIFGLIAIFAMGSTLRAQSSVNVSLRQPPPNQLKIADLWQISIVNTSKKTLNVYVQGTAKEATAGLVVDAQTASFAVPPGTKIVTGKDVSPIKTNSTNSKYKNILLQTGTVPAGDYTICVFVKVTGTGEELGSDCIEQHVASASIIPIAPPDEAALDDALPNFLWTSTPPLDPKASYTLKIVELLGSQTPFSATQSNSTFFERSDLHSTSMQYPITGQKLQPGRKYAWFVKAFQDGGVIGESEVWQFTAKAADSIVPYKAVIKKKALAQFEKAYGGSGYDHTYAMQVTRDSGYILAGYTTSFGAGGDDAYLIKTDRNGVMEWSKAYGGTNDDAFYDVKQTDDKGYVAVGYTRSFDVGNDDIYVVKTTDKGSVEWSRTFGGGGYDAGYSIQPTDDGGYIIAGAIGKGDDFDGYILKLDKGGNARWGSTIGGPQCDVMHAVVATPDGYVAAGYTRTMGLGNDDMYIVGLDREGTVRWATTYGGGFSDRAYALATTRNGIVVGGFRPNDHTLDVDDVCLLMLSLNGSPMARANYKCGPINRGFSVAPTPDRGYVVAGYTAGDSVTNIGGVLAFKTNVDGAVEWSRLYQGSKLDEGYAVATTPDGGYAVAGWTGGLNGGDCYLIKTDMKGVVGCTDKDAAMKGEPARQEPQFAGSLGSRGVVTHTAETKTESAATVETLLCPKDMTK